MEIPYTGDRPHEGASHPPQAVPWSLGDAAGVVGVTALLTAFLAWLVLYLAAGLEEIPRALRGVWLPLPLVLLGFVTFAWIRLRYRTARQLAGPGPVKPWDVLRGVGWGVFAFVAINVGAGLMLQAIARTAGTDLPVPQEQVRQLAVDPVLIGWLLVTAVVVAPLGEELFFRGMLLQSLRTRMSRRWSIGLSALVFAAAHTVAEPARGAGLVVFVLILPMGVLLGWLFLRRGNLLVPIVVHATFNLITTLALIAGQTAVMAMSPLLAVVAVWLVATAAAGCRSLPSAPIPVVLTSPAAGDDDADQAGHGEADRVVVPPVASDVAERDAAEEEPVGVADVTYAGFDAVLPPQELSRLARRAPLAAGEPLSRDDMTETAQLARSRLQEAGYPYARVLIDETRVAPGLVGLTVRAEPGPIAFFGRIDIAGNQHVDDVVIRRYLAFRPGERFRVSPILESQRRLSALRLFEAVDIEVLDGDTAPAEVHTRVVVKERDPRQFELSLGYASEEHLSGELEWRNLNFLGGARLLSMLTRWSWRDRGVDGTFVEPYLLRPDLSLAVRTRAWFLDERLFNVLSLGGAATLSYMAGAHNVIGVTYTHEFERSRITEQALADVGRQNDLALLGLSSSVRAQEGLLSSVRLQLVRDTRDVPADARRGYMGSLSLVQAGGPLPGAFHYRETSSVGQHHHTVRGLTLVQRVGYGSIDPVGPAAMVPFFKRYFLGGAESLRGWGRFEVSPLSDTGAPLGGHSYFAATSELRVPLVRTVGAAAFLDAGNVWTRPWTLRPGDLRYSVGAGVRYQSPFGPVRLDLGYQITPLEDLRIGGEPQRRRWRVHFGAGQAF